VRLRNTGSRDGAEVVQVYVRDPRDADGPQKTLRAFQRVELKAGSTQTVTLPLPRESFELWDSSTNTMRVVPGVYEVYVGTSSLWKDLRKLTVEVK
jgi:beta-glucosidase